MDICDPEWGPFFMNYKWLKKQLHIVANELESLRDAKGETVSRSDVEKEFFRGIMTEMRRVSDFFESTEKSCLIRRARIITGIEVLRGLGTRLNKHDWSRTLAACVKFYKDAVLIENFAILHLSGFGKIIKKHDKITG
jgi:SPX domain protein involved in polyphosphate accumulation